jgi:hypothetical protein
LSEPILRSSDCFTTHCCFSAEEWNRIEVIIELLNFFDKIFSNAPPDFSKKEKDTIRIRLAQVAL